MAAEQQTFAVEREEDAYVTKIGVHLEWIYQHYPEDSYTDFILYLPHPQEGQKPLKLELQTIREVNDTLTRYFDDPEAWTEAYLKHHKDKGLRLVQAQMELEKAEEDLARAERHVKSYGERVQEKRQALEALQKEHPDGK